MARAPHNTETIVREFLAQEKQVKAPEETENDFFEFYSPYLLLQDHRLSDEELRDGIVGAGGDGGVDSFFLFVNDILVTEDTNFNSLRGAPNVEIVIIQSKLERRFAEDTLNRLAESSRAMLALNVANDDFDDVYNEDIRSKFSLFRETYRRLLRNAPILKIRYFYTTVRPPNDISPGVEARRRALRAAAKERFPDAEVQVELLGAAEVWERIIRRPQEVRTLTTERASSGRQGYICLVALGHLNTFLRNNDGSVTQDIFEENVRDWQGLTGVNFGISEELSSGGDREFWWLNNGVTVLCTEFQNDDNLLSITNPQIVNGLQTCREITSYFDRADNDDSGQETRSVLVKVIRSEDDETRDRIIRATNSQNSVSVSMLRATDPFQRQLEEYFAPRDLFYERRKNYYANRGRPSRKLVSLTFMTQAALTFLENRPDDARARPSNPLKKEEEYRQLFDPETPLEIFFKAARICRDSEIYLKGRGDLSAKETNNLRFYVAMVAGWMAVDEPRLSTANISQIDLSEIDENLFERAYNFVVNSYRRLGAGDDVVKGARFKAVLRRKAQRTGLA